MNDIALRTVHRFICRTNANAFIIALFFNGIVPIFDFNIGQKNLDLITLASHSAKCLGVSAAISMPVSASFSAM